MEDKLNNSLNQEEGEPKTIEGEELLDFLSKTQKALEKGRYGQVASLIEENLT